MIPESVLPNRGDKEGLGQLFRGFLPRHVRGGSASQNIWKRRFGPREYHLRWRFGWGEGGVEMRKSSKELYTVVLLVLLTVSYINI